MKRITLAALIAMLALIREVEAQAPPLPLTATVYPSIRPNSKLDGCFIGMPCIDNRSSYSRQDTIHSYRAYGTGAWSVDMQWADGTPTVWTSYGNTAVVTNVTPSSGIGTGLDPSSGSSNGHNYHDYIRFVMTGAAVIENYVGTHNVWMPVTAGTISYPLTVNQGGTGSITTTGWADNLYFLSTLTGAVSRTANSKLGDIISVKDFGATGSGSTVDTAAIQATIQAASTAGGGTVYFPKGSYLTSALTMRSDVALVCASGTTFLANDNSEIMFNTGSGVDNTGLIADGGYCNISGNGKTGFQAIGITGGAGASTSNTYRGLLISGAAIGIETTNTYFNLFENIRVTGPTTAAYMFEAATTATKCLNCSAIATTGSPIGFTIHNGGNIVFEGTIEGTLLSYVYQVSGVQLSNVYFENTGSTNAFWLQVGTQTGTTTTGVAIFGCSFNVGAQYGIMVEQVTGLSVTGNAFQTSLSAFKIDNTGSVNGNMRGLNVRGNSYNIGGLGYDPTKIYVYTNAAANNLTNNVGDDSSSPLIFSPVTPGTLVTPPDVALSNTQGVSYVDGATGQLRYRYRDNSGTMHQNILITDSTISAIAIGPNIVDNPGGVANAVTATFTDATGTNVPVAAGLHILLHLIGGVSFQAGANTFNLNASGAKAVYQSTNIANLTTAIANGAYVDMIYDGTGWQVLSQ